MELSTKPDYKDAMARWEAWWQCELIDRPLLTMWVQPGQQREVQWPAPKTYATLEDRWFDLDAGIACTDAGVDAGLHWAESIPQWWPNLGPEIVATLFGAELQFSEGTSWSVPIIKHARDVLALQPNLNGRYWQAIRRATDASLARGQGRWITGITDLHTNIDLLAALLDPQTLCMELLDDPEGVGLAMEHISGLFEVLFDDLYSRVAAAGQPATSWLGAFHQGAGATLQADFICMISQEMFRRFALPVLTIEAQHCSRSIYHLDGPRALTHLDDLLAMPDLSGIQWVYGPGTRGARDWIPVYQRIQAAGKCVQIICPDADDARALLPHIRPEGAWFAVGGAYTLAQAEAFAKELRDWMHHSRR